MTLRKGFSRAGGPDRHQSAHYPGQRGELPPGSVPELIATGQNAAWQTQLCLSWQRQRHSSRHRAVRRNGVVLTSRIFPTRVQPGPALTDLLWRTCCTDLRFSSLPPAIGLVKEGKLRALGVTSFDALPFVSRCADGGRAVGCPASKRRAALRGSPLCGQTPTRPIIEKLNAALRTALSDPPAVNNHLAMGGRRATLPRVRSNTPPDIDREEAKRSALVKSQRRRGKVASAWAWVAHRALRKSPRSCRPRAGGGVSIRGPPCANVKAATERRNRRQRRCRSRGDGSMPRDLSCGSATASPIVRVAAGTWRGLQEVLPFVGGARQHDLARAPPLSRSWSASRSSLVRLIMSGRPSTVHKPFAAGAGCWRPASPGRPWSG